MAHPGTSRAAWLMSGEGHRVAFQSDATNLDPDGDDNPTMPDVFVRDTASLHTFRVSEDAAGHNASGQFSLSPALDGDGSTVVFISRAPLAPITNTLPQVYAKEVGTGAVTLVSRSTSGVVGDALAANPSISRDGLVVAYNSEAENLAGGGATGKDDVFVTRLPGGSTTLVSAAIFGVPNGGSTFPALQGDGHGAVFVSGASNLPGSPGNGFNNIYWGSV